MFMCEHVSVCVSRVNQNGFFFERLKILLYVMFECKGIQMLHAHHVFLHI